MMGGSRQNQVRGRIAHHITVAIPAQPMARPLMAPSTSPISRALVVPVTWLLVPMATPMATGFVILNSLAKDGQTKAPKLPVMIIPATVMAGIPPKASVRLHPMAVVTDLGARERITFPGICTYSLTEEAQCRGSSRPSPHTHGNNNKSSHDPYHCLCFKSFLYVLLFYLYSSSVG